MELITKQEAEAVYKAERRKVMKKTIQSASDGFKLFGQIEMPKATKAFIDFQKAFQRSN